MEKEVDETGITLDNQDFQEEHSLPEQSTNATIDSNSVEMNEKVRLQSECQELSYKKREMETAIDELSAMKDQIERKLNDVESEFEDIN